MKYFVLFFLGLFCPACAVDQFDQGDWHGNITTHPFYRYLKSQPPELQHYLEISGNSIHKAGAAIIAAFIHERQNLTHASFVACNLDDQECQPILTNLAQHSNLKYLNLGLNNLAVETGQGLAVLTQTASKLGHLDLHLNNFMDDSLAVVLKNLQEHNHISYLDIGMNWLHRKTVKAVCDLLHNCNSLDELLLSSIHLSKTQKPDLLAAIAASQSVSTVSLAYNNLPGSGREIGSMIRSCKTLAKLNLVWCGLTQDDFYQLLDEVNQPLPKRRSFSLFSGSQPETRCVKIELEKTPDTLWMQQYYQNNKLENPVVELIFQIGPVWD